ncbi:MAG: alpha-N-arabinofuranosidase [Oscillospiraceae bacterium]|nr:alpha-N-arabinofuranosidase [Oscillospiraceae bacterium]
MKQVTLTVYPEKRLSRINREIYGHFAEHLGRCIYNGIYVGEDSPIPNRNGVRTDIIDALKRIRIPVLRWPGGCFADDYHWRDGIGEKSARPKRINTNWGGVTEDNRFGTHEFMCLCEELGCEPYIAGNVGSGTVRELSDWVEYMTFDGDSALADERRRNGREAPWKLKYLGIGNENWGCGGNMRPEYYADVYKQYQSFCRNYSGNTLYKVACGPSGGDYNWMRVLLENVRPWHTNAVSMHYYTIPTGDWSRKGAATVFSDEEYYGTVSGTLVMEELLTKHTEIMDELDPEGKIGLIVDEWGCWYDVEEGTHPGFLYQQNAMRDAIAAAINLNLFNAHSRRVVMANLAQTVNVLQSVILTEGERMLLTPTYHVFDLFKEHQGAELLASKLEGFDRNGTPMVTGSVSEKDGCLLITVSNADLTEDAELTVSLGGFAAKRAEAMLLTAPDPRAFNSFEEPERVKPLPCEAVLCGGHVTLKLPACSVTALRIFG